MRRREAKRKSEKVTVKAGLGVSQSVLWAKMEGSMQKWTRKAAAVMAVICPAFGTAGEVMHKWNEMRQEKAYEELTAQVVECRKQGRQEKQCRRKKCQKWTMR